MISPQLRPATSGLARTTASVICLRRARSRRRTRPRRRGCRGRARRPRPPCARPWSGRPPSCRRRSRPSPGRAGTGQRRARRGMAGEPTTARSSTPGRVPLGEAFPTRRPRRSVRRRKDNSGSVQTPRTDAANTGKTRQKEQALNGIRTPDRTGRPRREGAVDPSSLHDARGPSLRHGRVGAARRAHRSWRQGRLRADRRRVPEHVVAERDEHRRPEVLPRPARARPRASARSSR